MKKFTFIILFLAGILLQAKAYVPIQSGRQLRDSIFRVASSKSNDTLRTQYLRGVFQQHIGEQQALEYLDSALIISKQKKIAEEELYTLFDYYRHYEYLGDSRNMERSFLRLKETSYQHKNYVLYFTAWLALLQFRSAHGDTEYAIIKAKEMKKEAIRLNYKSGEFVSLLTLSQALFFAEQYDEAVASYKQILKEFPDANYYSQLLIHTKLTRIYLAQKKYKESLYEAQQQLNAIENIIKEDPKAANKVRISLLDAEISFGKAYLEMKDKANLRLHLERAGKYYDKKSFYNSYIDYHSLWGGYYRLTKEWDKCFREFDLALDACHASEAFYVNGVRKLKAAAMLEAGHYKEAANIYRITALRGDSLNQETLQRHKEVHEANYKIQKALFDKEKMKKQYRWFQVGISAAIFVLLLLAVIKAFFIQRQLRHSENETRKALEAIKAADKMKELFLQNITYEIRIPLNTVVGFSELLSSEKDLSPEEIQEYSAAIKTNSGKLLALINNILDLSRLEAGMMRFNVQECDVVQLCREAKMMIAMQAPDSVELKFDTDLEELLIQADSKWFLKALTSLFVVPRQYAGKVCKVKYTLSKADRYLTIVIEGSPLYQCWKDEQEQRILHDINRLYVESFKGSYQVSEGEGKLVTITYPID